MPRTRDQLGQALAATEAWLDGLDPGDGALRELDGADARVIGESLRPSPAEVGFGQDRSRVEPTTT